LRDRIHLARVMRAHLASQLRKSNGASSYHTLPGTQNTWHAEG
jgi:hypothetical protein